MINFGIVRPSTSQPIQYNYNFWESKPKITLPEGGTEDSIEVDSVIQILTAVQIPRLWFLINLGDTAVRLFHAEVNSVESPFILQPGQWASSSPELARLPLYAWSEEGAGVVHISVYLQK